MDKATKNIIGGIFLALGAGAAIFTAVKYRQIAAAEEPVAMRYPLSNAEEIKDTLIRQGFQTLEPWALEEIKCDNELWGLGKYLDEHFQIHVRALILPNEPGIIGLSAHVEPRRDHIIDHLSGKGDYTLGEKILRQYMDKISIIPAEQSKF